MGEALSLRPSEIDSPDALQVHLARTLDEVRGMVLQADRGEAVRLAKGQRDWEKARHLAVLRWGVTAGNDITAARALALRGIGLLMEAEGAPEGRPKNSPAPGEFLYWKKLGLSHRLQELATRLACVPESHILDKSEPEDLHAPRAMWCSSSWAIP